MRTINVIVTCDSDGLTSINSFGIVDEQMSNEVAEQAEEKFRETIVRLKCEDALSDEADTLRDEIDENWLDEGVYELHDEDRTTVFLTWSSINNVQL